MAFDWSQLITPAFITAAATGLGKLAQNLLNHKSTENFEKQTDELKAVIQQGNAELKGVISGGNDAWFPPLRDSASSNALLRMAFIESLQRTPG